MTELLGQSWIDGADQVDCAIVGITAGDYKFINKRQCGLDGFKDRIIEFDRILYK